MNNPIKNIDDFDYDIIKRVKDSGTRKNKPDILYLFYKYIDSSINICSSCGSEIIMAYEKFLFFYELYIKDNPIKDEER